MESDSQREANAFQRITERRGTQHCLGRALKRGQEAIPNGVDLTTTAARNLATDNGMVALEQGAPTHVSERRRNLGRTDDVGEHDRRQYAVGVLACTEAGDDLPHYFHVYPVTLIIDPRIDPSHWR